MKKALSLLLALILLVTPLLTACGSQEQTGISLVVILGYHANACRPTPDMLENSGLPVLIENAISYYKDSRGSCHAQANIKFILCDGNPSVIEPTLNGEPITMHYESGNFSTLKEDMSYLSEDIITALADPTLKADDPESDLLGALSMAGDLLRSNPGAQNHIMVIDTGLNTAGALKMQDKAVCENIQGIGKAGVAPGAAADAADLAAKDLVGKMAPGSVADLSNTYVTFYGMGNVDNVSQATITDQLIKDSLTKFWTAFFNEAGATLVTDIIFTVNENGIPMVHSADGDGDNDSSNDNYYHFVSSIPFVSEEINWTVNEESTGNSTVVVDEDPLTFNASTLAFQSQSAKFKDRNQAIAEITSRQAYFDQILNANPNAMFYVVGSIAKTSPDRTQEEGNLSRDRALAVAKIMVEECGIPSSQIFIIPAGLTVLTWRNSVEFPNGQRTEETPANMQRNRVVAIVPSVFSDVMSELDSKGLLQQAIPYAG